MKLLWNAEIAQFARARLLLAAGDRNPVFDQRLEDLRAVEAEQRLTCLDMLARGTGIDLLDKAFGPQRDRTFAPLIQLDRTRCMDGFDSMLPLDLLGPDTSPLHLFDTHLDNGRVALVPSSS